MTRIGRVHAKGNWTILNDSSWNKNAHHLFHSRTCRRSTISEPACVACSIVVVHVASTAVMTPEPLDSTTWSRDLLWLANATRITILSCETRCSSNISLTVSCDACEHARIPQKITTCDHPPWRYLFWHADQWHTGVRKLYAAGHTIHT